MVYFVVVSTDIEWLLEEIYIFSPLDDDRMRSRLVHQFSFTICTNQ